jgi:hypothetical protein
VGNQKAAWQQSSGQQNHNASHEMALSWQSNGSQFPTRLESIALYFAAASVPAAAHKRVVSSSQRSLPESASHADEYGWAG